MKPYEKYVVAFFFLGAIVFIFFASRREYRIEGDKVSVKTPQAVTTLQKSGVVQQSVYMLVGEGLPENDYYHAEIPVLPLGTVNELNEKYGDFRKCTSDGSLQAKNSVVSLRLIGANTEIAKKIATLYKESKKKADAFVRIQGTNLEILNHTIRSNRGKILPPQPVVNILVEDIEILEQ